MIEIKQNYPNLEVAEQENMAFTHFGLCWNEDGEAPSEWVEIAQRCKNVIVAWGNCGNAALKKVKDKVKMIPLFIYFIYFIICIIDKKYNEYCAPH